MGAASKESYNEDTYPNLLHRFLKFEDEMSVICVVWRDCHQLLESYNEEQVQIIKAQCTSLNNTLEDRYPVQFLYKYLFTVTLILLNTSKICQILTDYEIWLIEISKGKEQIGPEKYQVFPQSLQFTWNLLTGYLNCLGMFKWVWCKKVCNVFVVSCFSPMIVW